MAAGQVKRDAVTLLSVRGFAEDHAALARVLSAPCAQNCSADRLAELAQPLLIVGSRTADDSLWAEALNFGAYDVLAKPLEPMEVMRALNLAWLRWKRAPPQECGPVDCALRAGAVA